MTVLQKLEEANKLKTEGNALFKAEKFKAAYDMYERALEFFRFDQNMNLTID